MPGYNSKFMGLLVLKQIRCQLSKRMKHSNIYYFNIFNNSQRKRGARGQCASADLT